jgi:pre-mRNA-processing factor SLU7
VTISLGGTMNLHVPKFIAEVPWYVTDKTDKNACLERQKNGEVRQNQFGMDLEGWYPRGQHVIAATKFRNGAFENCGAMTHIARNCLDHPRKLGAKWTGKDIQADDILVDFTMSFEE